MDTTSTLVYGMTETDLVEGCIAGRRDCQEQLYKHFSPKMFGICLRYSGDYHTAEDILQEGFIKIFNNIDRYRGDGSFEGWLKRIFVNTAIEHYRKSFKFEDFGTKNTNEEIKNEDVMDKLKTQDLLKIVQKLSPGYRAVFNMYAIEGFSHKEIADSLNISEGTSKSQLARARNILQKLINENA
jgi:RNA polymerase sigma factor (sigma-70 family)